MNVDSLIGLRSFHSSLRPPAFVGRASVVENLVTEQSRARIQAGAVYDVDANLGALLELDPGLWFVVVPIGRRLFRWGRWPSSDKTPPS